MTGDNLMHLMGRSDDVRGSLKFLRADATQDHAGGARRPHLRETRNSGAASRTALTSERVAARNISTFERGESGMSELPLEGKGIPKPHASPIDVEVRGGDARHITCAGGGADVAAPKDARDGDKLLRSRFDRVVDRDIRLQGAAR